MTGIWHYTVERWDGAQAESYIRAIQMKLAQIQQDPNLGRSREELRHGLYPVRVSSHVAYYTISPNNMQIVRILHSKMDAERHL